MLRIAVFSLLLGALALLASLTLFFSPPTTTGQEVPAVIMSATTAKVIAGAGTLSHEELPLELNAAGVGVVTLASTEIAASSYPFLHLGIADSATDSKVSVVWKRSDTGGKMYSYPVESHARKSLWLATNELQGWTGSISFLGLVVAGRAAEIVRISDFSLFPASPSHQIQALHSDLTSYVPWNRAAMNTHTGVTQVSSFYPVPLIVAYLILCLLGYGLLLLVFRAKFTFNWRVVALIFLACWISLDMVWQNRLLHQLADTYRTFSGKNTQEKLAVGPDAKLYDFVAQVKPLLESKHARIFVSSNDEYLGQRAAYFLYPFNVYWPEPGRNLPRYDFFHSGDYIVLINPTTMRFDPRKNTLWIPNTGILDAELVFSTPLGTVLRPH